MNKPLRFKLLTKFTSLICSFTGLMSRRGISAKRRLLPAISGGIFFLLLSNSFSSYSQQIDLEIKQTVSNQTPAIGSVIQLVLTATNKGNLNATGVTVNDLLPLGLIYKSKSPVSANYDPNTGIWNIGNLNIGKTATITIDVTVSNCDSYTNFINISGAEVENILTNNVSTLSIAPVYTISGTVFHDVNGFTDNISNYTANTPPGFPVSVSLINSANAIFSNTIAANDGKYTFSNITGGTYKLVVNNNSSGSSTSVLPPGWVNTASGFDGGSDGVNDGVISFRTNDISSTALVFKEDFLSGSYPGPELAPGISTHRYKNVTNPASSTLKLQDGEYTIANVATQGYNNWQPVYDHTTGSSGNGYYLLVNADEHTSEFYNRKVSQLLPNQGYQLSFWAVNVNSQADYNYCTGAGGFIFPNIKYSINSSATSTVLRTGATGVIAYAPTNVQWTNYTFDFVTGPTDTEVNFILSNISPGGCGNDLGIDDISIRKIPCNSINSVKTDFGIQQIPVTSTSRLAVQPNPGGTVAVNVSASSFSGTDYAGGTLISANIKSFPANAKTLIIGGISYDSGNFPAGGINVDFNTAQFQVDPLDGNVTVDISYSVKDNAGFESANTGVLSIPFEVLGVDLSGPSQVAENVAGSVAKYDVTLKGSPGIVTAYPITIQTKVNSGTAGTADYSLATSAVTFPAGSVVGSKQSFDVTIVNDLIVEGDEDYTAVISTLTGDVNIGVSSVATLIKDDDLVSVVLTGDPRITEGNTANYSVTLTGTPGGSIKNTVTVNYLSVNGTAGSTASGGAANSGDFESVSGTVTFPAGSLIGAVMPVTVIINKDLIVEGDENYKVSINNPVGATLGIAEAGTIITDINFVTVKLLGSTVVNEGKIASYLVQLTGEPGTTIKNSITVKCIEADGTAISPADYIQGDGVLPYEIVTFDAGSTVGITIPFTVSTVDDKIVEGNETYTASISVLTGLATLDAVNSLVTTIRDDDVVTVDLTGLARVTEGDAVIYRVTLNGAAGGSIKNPVSVTYKVTDGTAVSPADYTYLANQTITFPAGSVVGDYKEFTVTTINDKIVEGDEDYTASIGDITGLATLGSQTVNTIITDNDAVTVDLTGLTRVNEGDAVVYRITLNGITGGSIKNPVSVTYKVTDGTAVLPADYTYLANQTITFPAGSVVGDYKEFIVTTINDKIIEGDEDYTASIGDLTGLATINSSNVNTIITDNDVVTVDLAGLARVTEGDAVVYRVTLNGAIGGSIKNPVSVTYKVTDGTAVSPADYTYLVNQTITFPAGSVVGDYKEFTVTTINDKIVEGDEDYTASIGDVTGLATISSSTVNTIITDNDAVTVDLTGLARVNEGDAVIYRVTLNGTTGGSIKNPVSVTYKVTDGTAVSPADYTYLANQTITFPAGSVVGDHQEFTVTTINDKIVEGDEDYTASIGDITGLATISSSSANTNTVITDNDAVTMDLTGLARVNEGDAVIYRVTLNGTTGGSIKNPVSVTYKVTDDTAVSPADYTYLANQTITFPAGSVVGDFKEFTVTTINDKIVEGDEDYTASIGDITGLATINSSTVNTIITDNDVVTVDLTGLARVNEGDAVVYRVTLNGTTGGSIKNPVSVTYKVADDAAVSPVDYTYLANQTITFPAGSVVGDHQEFTVTTINDKIVEGDEDYTASIGDVTGLATINSSTVNTIITDNDAVTVDLMGLARVTEGDAVIYRVTLNGTTGGSIKNPVSVTYKVTDGTAVSPVDYTYLANQTITFPAGSVVGDYKEFTVTTINDKIVEGDEDYTASIGDLTGLATVNSSTVNTIITDNDVVTVDLTGLARVTEGDAVIYRVTLNGTTGGSIKNPVSVTYKVTDDTAVSPADYTYLANQTITFPAGSVVGDYKEFTVTTINDKIVEGDEDYTASIGDLTGLATINSSSVNTIITDNDVVTIDLTGLARVNEGDAVVYRVTLNGTTGGSIKNPVSVTYKVTDGTAVSPADYTYLANQTITFPTGSVVGDHQEFTVTTINDKIVEGDEDYTASIGDITGLATINSSSVNTIITDNDAVTVDLTGLARVTEGDAVIYRVTLNGATGGSIKNPVSVTYKVTDDTAVSPADYTYLANQTITFPAGSIVGDYKEFTVITINDKIVEGDEDYTASIGDLTGLATLGNQTVNTIITDNDVVTVDLTGLARVNEGDAVIYRVTLNGTTGGSIKNPVSVTYKVTDGTAVSPADYTYLANQIITFPAGSIVGDYKEFTVTTINDRIVEGDEDYTASIGDLTGLATFGNQAINTIITDNDVVTVDLTGLAHVTEGDAVIYRVTLNGTTGGSIKNPVSVTYKVTDGATVSPADYTYLANQTITFPAGSVVGDYKEFTVITINDKIVEGDEDYTASIGDVTGLATINSSSVNTVITDNDVVTVDLTGLARVIEGDAVIYRVTLNGTTGGSIKNPVSVTYKVTDGAAISPADYTYLVNQTITFSAGSAVGDYKEFTVTTINDKIVEGDEDYSASIGDVTGLATINSSSVNTIITDNDVVTVDLTGLARVTEGDAVIYRVTLNGTTGGSIKNPVSVTYKVTDDTAVSPVDYTYLANQTITFPAGSVVGDYKEFTVITINDKIVEGDEDYTASIGDVTGLATISSSSVNTVITDNDAVTIDLTGLARVTEGDAVVYRVTLNGTTGGSIKNPVSVTYKVTDGTSVSPADYTYLANQTITFPAGSVVGDYKEFTVTTINDKIVEGDEDYTASIGDLTGLATINSSTVNTIITDNDAVTVDLTGLARVNEGDAVIYRVTLNGATGGSIKNPVSVTYKVTDGTSVSPADYTYLANQTITFPVGSVVGDYKEFTVTTINDKIVEGDEDYTTSIGEVTGLATINSSTVNTIITDNDAVTVDLTGLARVTEGDAVIYRVTLNGITGGSIKNPVSVTYKVTDGTAFSPVDYTYLTNQTITFPAGSVVGDYKEFTVTTINDKIVEGDEDYTASIGDVTGLATISSSTVNTVITDNDAVTIDLTGLARVNEGDAVVYRVTLNGTTGGSIKNPVSVTYKVTDGTAVSPADYTYLANQTITFPAGSVVGDHQEFTVTTINDKIIEGDEDYTASIGDITGLATLGNQTINTIITDNDAVTVDLTGLARVNEGDAVIYRVTLNGTPGGSIKNLVSVTYKVTDGAAVSPADYTYLANQTITFPAGAAVGDYKEFTVTTINDKIVEGDEDYTASIGDLTGLATFGNQIINTIITDNDAVTVDLTGLARVNEGDAVVYRVTLNGTTGGSIKNPVSVTYKVTDGTAVSPADYTYLANQTITFPAGAVVGDHQEFTVTTINDKIVEGDEDYSASIGDVTGLATLNNQTVNTIITDNDAVTVDLTGLVRVTEGDAVVYKITLNGTTGGSIKNPVSVTYKVTDGTAVSPADYTYLANQTITFPAGSVVGDYQEFTVTTINDKIVEGDEDYTASIGDVTGLATLNNQTVNTIITDNDAVTVDLAGLARVTEGDVVIYRVTLNGTTDGSIKNPVSVTYKVTDGTAVSLADYTYLANQTITFPAGSAVGDYKEFTVTTINDKIVEGDEDYTASIGDITGLATLGNQTVNTIITDNDVVTVDLTGPVRITEGEQSTYTITLNGTPGGSILNPVSIKYSTTDGTAISPADYTSSGGTFIFPAGSVVGTTKTFTVQTINDNLGEPDESYTANLSDISGRALLGNPAVQTTITDVNAPSVTLTDASALEGINIIFPVRLSNPSTTDIQLVYKLTPVTAGNLDYNTSDVTVLIRAGETHGSLIVPAFTDDLLETDETFTISYKNILSGIVGSATSAAIGTIIDNNGALKFTKEVTGTLPGQAGETLNYNLTVTNIGHVLIRDIAIQDNNAIIPGQVIPSLAPNAIVIVAAAHILTQLDIDAGKVINQAIVSGKDPNNNTISKVSDDPLTPLPDDATITPITQHPSLIFTKETTGSIPSTPGGLINYILNVTNTGNVTLHHINITDPNAIITGGAPISSLAPHTSITVTATHQLTQSDIDAGQVINQAALDATGPLGNTISKLSDNPSTPAADDPTITPIVPSGSIGLVKIAALSVTNRNIVDFTFKITNTGNVTLKNIELNDPLLGGAITINNVALAPSASIIISKPYVITQQDRDRGKIINTATTKGITPNGATVTDISGTDLTNDDPTIIVIGNRPAIKLIKTGIVSTDKKEIVYSFDIINTGDVTLKDLHLADAKIPQNIILSNYTIAPGATVTARVTYTITLAERQDGRVVNTALITGYTTEGNAVTALSGTQANNTDPTVHIIPDAPQAINDLAEVIINKLIDIPILDNDLESLNPIDKSSISVTSPPANGKLEQHNDGTITYTPDKGYSGQDSFTYTIADTRGNRSNTALVSIKVTPIELFIPNTITPNGDGKNDTFRIIGRESFDSIDLLVFNRWGNEVYKNGNYMDEWDGSGLADGTYYYIITLKKAGSKVSKNGWILIKR
jgi:gliding motility-associated-like protein